MPPGTHMAGPTLTIRIVLAINFASLPGDMANVGLRWFVGQTLDLGPQTCCRAPWLDRNALVISTWLATHA